MEKSAVYFFAEYPIDLAMWAGLADIIREVTPGLPLVLIWAAEHNSRDYQWDPILDSFDQVHRVSWTYYIGGVTSYGICTALLSGFPRACKVASELQKIELLPNSVAFVRSGQSLITNMFLKRVQSEPTVVSVLTTVQTDNVLLNDFILNYSDSMFRNFYHHFFGTAYVDWYWLKADYPKMKRREQRFRNKPADFVFSAVYPFGKRSLEPGQVYYPLYSKNGPLRSALDDSVVFFGQPLTQPAFAPVELGYQRLNELLELIRIKHVGARLIYKPHPMERSEYLARLDLRGFELETSLSSELLVLKDRSISTAYTVYSASALTTPCFGVRSYFLYHLFDNDILPDVLKRSFNTFLDFDAHPARFLKSVDDWMNGKNDYEPKDVSDRIRTSTIKMLELVGVIDSVEGFALDPTIIVTPEERWARRSDWSFKSLLWKSLAFFPRLAWVIFKKSSISLLRRVLPAWLRRKLRKLLVISRTLYQRQRAP